MPTYRSASGSSAEDLFIELFSDTFGAEKAGYLYSQYPFSDIYQNSRFADFLIENGGRKVAIEIDDEASHNPKLVSQNKFYDDLLKQNSMIYLGWDVYRWAVRQMQQQLARISQAYPAIPTITADGVFGERTREAVEAFQRIFDLPVSGVVDFPTWYKISQIYVGVTRIAELN